MMAKDPAERQPSGEGVHQRAARRPGAAVQAASATAGSRRSLLLAAAVFGGLMLLASGSALAMVGPELLGAMLSGDPSLAEPTVPAAETTPAATAVPTPTRDPAIFPDADEEALLARVPSLLRASCERVPSDVPTYTLHLMPRRPRG